MQTILNKNSNKSVFGARILPKFAINHSVVFELHESLETFDCCNEKNSWTFFYSTVVREKNFPHLPTIDWTDLIS